MEGSQRLQLRPPRWRLPAGTVWDGDRRSAGMGMAAHRLPCSGNGTATNPGCSPETVFLKHRWKHCAVGPASHPLPTRDGCPAAHSSPGLVFPGIFHQPSRARHQFASRLITLALRPRGVPGHNGCRGGCARSGTDQVHPQGGSWAGEPPPSSPRTSLDVIAEVTPKLPQSNISQSYALRTP